MSAVLAVRRWGVACCVTLCAVGQGDSACVAGRVRNRAAVLARVQGPPQGVWPSRVTASPPDDQELTLFYGRSFRTDFVSVFQFGKCKERVRRLRADADLREMEVAKGARPGGVE